MSTIDLSDYDLERLRSDVTELFDLPAATLAAVQGVHDTVETIVIGTIRALWWPTLVVTAVPAIPLVIWLIIGDLLA